MHRHKETNRMTTVGIIGCGFVGGALKDWLEKNNKDVNVGFRGYEERI